MPDHTLIVVRDHDDEFGPDASIECHGVTEACAEWIECRKPECSTDDDERSALDDFTAHGEQHRYSNGDLGNFWAVRSGGCYAESRNDADAQEFAEKRRLGSGRYPVDVEIDDSTVIITLAEVDA